MANLNETDEWFAGIYQLEEDDPVLGGPAGIDNLAPRQLASRGLYQRLRNVTPWSALLAYPADTAYVGHDGTTWKSVAASTGVQPGTDETKWMRWAHTDLELSGKIGEALDGHESELDPHEQYARWAALAALIASAEIEPDRGIDSQLTEAVTRVANAKFTTITGGATALTKANAGLVVVDASAGNVTITLPAGDGPIGLDLVRTDNVAANTVTVSPAGADKFQPGNLGTAQLAANPCRLLIGEWLRMRSNAAGQWFGKFLSPGRAAYWPNAGTYNWTAPPFVVQAKSKVWGGGGGGGSAGVATASATGACGGGYSEGVFAVVPGTTYTVTVGQGGTTSPGGNGGAGGTSSFASFNSATGGSGGFLSGGGAQTVVGTAGLGSGGTVNLYGQGGGQGQVYGSTYCGGSGGGAYCSATAPGATGGGGAGMKPGGGGSGGANSSVGGAGAPGAVHLEY